MWVYDRYISVFFYTSVSFDPFSGARIRSRAFGRADRKTRSEQFDLSRAILNLRG